MAIRGTDILNWKKTMSIPHNLKFTKKKKYKLHRQPERKGTSEKTADLQNVMQEKEL